MFLKTFFLCAFSLSTAFAETTPSRVTDESGLEEFNPFAANVEEMLEEFDAVYEAETGVSAFPAGREQGIGAAGCYQHSCAIFVDIDKASQTLRLYLNGRFADQWMVSTGTQGFRTPNYNKRFNGRIYHAYTSSKYPGGDYNGLGNMPYAMFISGGIALHGTPRGNWARLGQPASHGCIRVHPDNAAYLNQHLRRAGVQNSWVVVR